jgi:streptogramin lyase
MRRFLPLIVTAVLVLATPAALAAEPALDGEFEVIATPSYLAEGPDGNVWFTLGFNGAGKEIGRIAPDGTLTYFDSPGNVSVDGVTAGGGRVWFSYDDGIVDWDPVAGSGTAHPVTEIGTARAIARTADGDLWVVDDESGSVVRLGADGGFKKEILGEELNDTNMGAPQGRGITVTSDGKVWWGDFGQGAVQAVDPATDTAKGYLLGGKSGVQELVAGPAGQLAVGDPGTDPHTIARVSTADGSAQTTDAPNTDPFGMTFGNDGAYWVTLPLTAELGRLTPEGELTRPIAFAAGANPRYVATGAGDTLWVSLQDPAKPRIARVTGVDAPDPPGQNPPPPPPPPPPPGDITAPFFSSVGLTRSVFAVGTRRTAVAAQRRRVRRGTTLRFTLSEAATVRIRVQRRRAGRRRAGKCVKPTARLRRRGARTCVRWVRALPTLRRAGTAGLNKVRFTGRVRRRALRPGRYRFRMTATDAAANRSPARTKRFRIVRAARRG